MLGPNGAGKTTLLKVLSGTPNCPWLCFVCCQSQAGLCLVPFLVLVDLQHSSTCKCWILHSTSCSHFCLSQHGVSNVTDDHAFWAGQKLIYIYISVHVGAVGICHRSKSSSLSPLLSMLSLVIYQYQYRYHRHHGSMTINVGAVPIWGGMRHLGEGAKVSVFSQDLAQVSPLLQPQAPLLTRTQASTELCTWLVVLLPACVVSLSVRKRYKEEHCTPVRFP